MHYTKHKTVLITAILVFVCNITIAQKKTTTKSMKVTFTGRSFIFYFSMKEPSNEKKIIDGPFIGNTDE